MKLTEMQIGRLYQFRKTQILPIMFYGFKSNDFESIVDLFAAATCREKLEDKELIVLLGTKKINTSMLKNTDWIYVLRNDMLGWLMFRQGDWEEVS